MLAMMQIAFAHAIRASIMAIDRKAAVAAYKKREALAGVFALRAAGGGTWVGHARDMDAIGNRLWFMLRSGGHANHGLQQRWSELGETAFSLEPLEYIDTDALGTNPDKVLRGHAEAWREKLGADPV